MTDNEAATRLARLDAFLSRDPSNEPLRAEAFDAALAAGRLDAADRHLHEVSATDATSAGWRFRRSRLALARHDWHAARATLEGLFGDSGVDPALQLTARHDLAYVALREARLDDGIALLRPLAESGDDAMPPSFHALWLRLLHRAGAIDDAVEWARRQSKRRDWTAAAAGVASLAALDAGDLNAARDWSGDALSRNPAQHEALVARGNLALAEQQPETAAALLSDALKQAPRDGRTLSALAFAELQAGRWTAARERFGQALESMPAHVGTLHGLGWAALLQGDLRAAREAFEHAIELDRNFSESHGGLAVVLAKEDRRQAATAAIDRALGLDAACVAARYAQAVLAGKGSDPATLRHLAGRAFAARRGPG